MTNLIKTLNKAQKEAVTHGEGPLLIVAGAGTGKTMVITQRISHLILDKGVNTDAILALTFTEKAAGEMSERVDKMMPIGYTDLWISTFHSFCEKILKQHALDIGLPNDFKLLSETSQWLLVRQNLDKFNLDYYKPLGNPTKFIHGLLNHFSRCKDEEIYPDQYLEYAEKISLDLDSKQGDELLAEEAYRTAEVANAYHVYQQLLLDNNALDFGDLINYTLKLFKTRKNILKKYQEQFQYVLVDEFQDTNYAQYELVKLLAGKLKNLTVVADDDQSIYKFRGASVSNILNFNKDYPEAKKIVLTENYRSCQDILDLSYNFIKLNNPNRLECQEGLKIKKKLKSHSECEAEVEHLHFATLDDEVKGVIKKIVELKKKDKEALWSDFAILVRANDSATAFTNYLRKTDIPHQFVALKGLYHKPIILDILSFFKLLDNYHESPALFRILRSPIVNLPDEEITKICHFANKKNLSLYEALKISSTIYGVSPQSISEINRVIQLIEKQTALAREKTVGELMLLFMQESKYLEKILSADEALAQQNSDYLNQFYNRIKSFEEANPDPSLANFMVEMEMELESGEAGSLKFDIEAGPEVVKIMTVHAAKGLEFKYVFIPNMVDQRFPTNKRSDPIEIPTELVKDILPEGDYHLEEERRLFYVAMTRAKNGLYFSSADDYGGARKKKVSRFLVELSETNKTFKLHGLKSEAQSPELSAQSSVVIAPTPSNLPLRQGETFAQFSFSQIAGFKKCPYQYKLAFIFKIPVFGKGQFSYGKTLHSTLQKFMMLASERTAKAQTNLFEKNTANLKSLISNLITEDELLKLYEASWVDEWYASAQEKKEYKEKGKEALKAFYEKIKDQKFKTINLEKGFFVKIMRGKGEEMYTLKGFIDRIDQLVDGSVELIDYKTGKAKEKLEGEDKLQLLLYQLACAEVPAVTGGLKVSKLTFYYLDGDKQVSFLGSEKDLEKVKDEVISVIEEIKNSQFEATPEYNTCKYCDFKDICEFRL